MPWDAYDAIRSRGLDFPDVSLVVPGWKGLPFFVCRFLFALENWKCCNVPENSKDFVSSFLGTKILYDIM